MMISREYRRSRCVPERFADSHTYLGDFADRILARCPKCDRCATARQNSDDLVRIVCPSCGFAKVLSFRWPVFLKTAENCLPLWLETRCCGQILWAFNREHLVFLEAYVSADLREQPQSTAGRWNNGSLTSRLPKWMLSAKNRGDVLRGIKRLRRMLPEEDISS